MADEKRMEWRYALSVFAWGWKSSRLNITIDKIDKTGYYKGIK